MLNLNKTGNFMQKSAIIVLYLKKNYTQLFFVLVNVGAFKKNYTQQHSCNYRLTNKVCTCKECLIQLTSVPHKDLNGSDA